MKNFQRSVMMLSVLMVSGTVFAELTAGQKMAAEVFVKQFSAPDFDARQKAVDRLVEFGPDVAPVVKKALADTADNEVKLRCKMVLKALRDKFGAAAVDGGKVDTPAAPADARGASKVTLDVKDMPLSEVLAKLAEMSGNHKLHLDGADAPVTLTVKDAGYWQTVDMLAGFGQLIIAPHWVPGEARMEGRLQLTTPDEDSHLTGYAGPAVVKASSISRFKYLREPMVKFGMTPGPMDGFTLGLTCFWEDRLDPIVTEIELTKAQLAGGGSVLPPSPEARCRVGEFGPPGYMNGNKFPPCRRFNFNLPVPPRDATAIDDLSGVVRLEFGAGETDVRIDDVLHAVGKEIKVDPWTVKVLKVENDDGLLKVKIEVRFKGQVVNSMPSWWVVGSYGWYVQAGEGAKKVPSERATRGGGGGGRRGGGPARPAAQPQEPKKPGEQSISFRGDFDVNASLVLTLPKVHETKEYPFTIHNIKLP